MEKKAALWLGWAARSLSEMLLSLLRSSWELIERLERSGGDTGLELDMIKSWIVQSSSSLSSVVKSKT